MNHPGQLLAASFALLGAAGCATAPPPTGPALEAASATLEDYRRTHPHHPELAAYKFRLQERIDHAFFEAFRELQFSPVHLPGAGHGFTLRLKVTADGLIGADPAEVERVAAREPTLAATVFTAIADANRRGEPFPPALVAEVGPSFVYFAHFRMQ